MSNIRTTKNPTVHGPEQPDLVGKAQNRGMDKVTSRGLFHTKPLLWLYVTQVAFHVCLTSGKMPKSRKKVYFGDVVWLSAVR